MSLIDDDDINVWELGCEILEYSCLECSKIKCIRRLSGFSCEILYFVRFITGEKSRIYIIEIVSSGVEGTDSTIVSE